MTEEASSSSLLSWDPLGYYAILNVGPDATTQDIKHNYRQLVRYYHPDKIRQLKLKQNKQQKREGEEEEEEEEEGRSTSLALDLDAAAVGGFEKLQEAYEVLSDPVLREVYDTYGSEGLKAGRSIVQVDETAPSSLRRIREEIQKNKLKEEIYEDIRKHGVPEQYGRVRYSGLYHMALSANKIDLKGPNPSLVPLDLLNIGSFSLNSNVTIQATNKDIIMLGGHIGQSLANANSMRSQNVSQGSISLTGRRQVSPVHHLEFGTQMQTHPDSDSTLYTSAKSVRQLTKNDSASIELSLTSQGREYELELGLGSTRVLGEKSLGEFSVNLGSGSGTSLTIVRQAKVYASSFGIYAGKVMGITGQLSRVMKAGTGMQFLGKGSFKARTDAIEVELAASKKFPSTHLNVGWGAAVSYRGLYWRLRASHLGQRFLVPVRLSQTYSLPSIFATFAVPPLLVTVFMKTAYKPLHTWYKSMQNEEDGEGSEASLRSSFCRAASDCILMVGPALRKRKANYASGGIVIVEAIYGDIASFKEEEGGHKGIQRYNPSKLKNGFKWLDVTIPVQFLCKEGKITIHSGIHKDQLMGFCKPAAEDGNALLLRYLYKSKSYEVTVSDVNGVDAPREGHLIEDDALAAVVQSKAKEIIEEVAEDIINNLLS